MDKIEKETAALFLRLFDGNAERHIITDLRNAHKNEAGKLDGSTRKADGSLTVEKLMAHLETADTTFGVSPMRADSTCSWGVLDIDWYDMPDEEVRKLPEQLRAICTAFRSKSGGINVFVFASEPVRGRVMHDYLVSLRKRLPKKVRDKTEIFPAHTQTVVNPGDDPSSVHLPLNGTQRLCVFQICADGTQFAYTDDTKHSEVLERIDACGKIDADTMAQLSAETPTLDTSYIGYRIPDNPAGRNDLLMRVARSMQSCGWPDSELEAEIRRLNGDTNFHPLFADGPSPESEIRNILNGTKKLEKGAPTPLHYREVEKFNRRWSKITINGVVEYIDKDASDFTTFTKHMLFDETSDQVVRAGKSLVPIAQLWLRDPDHARFKSVVCEPIDYDGPAYNVWRGFAVVPKNGDASIFEKYVLEVLCSGDEGLAHWVTMWLADAVQNPTEPSPPTALALRGRQGGGKSFLQERVLAPIFGERYVQKVQESQRLFARFNRSLFGATFIACEESIFHGSQATAATLKSFISSPSWTYEEKHKAVVQAKNVHRIIATTNESQAVHVDFDDRRWIVVEVAQPYDMTTKEGQNEAYAFWEPYHAFMRSEDGPSIVLRYLLDYPVDRQALTYGYGTEAKARDKVASDPIIAVLHDIAESGVCPHDRKAAGIISNKTLTGLVHQAGGRNMSSEEIANKLLDLIPLAEKSRKAIFVAKTHAYTDMNGDASVTPLIETRQRGYFLGTLAKFREDVSRITLQEYGEDDTAMDFGDADPAEFGVDSLNGWQAWETEQSEKFNGDPPF